MQNLAQYIRSFGINLIYPLENFDLSDYVRIKFCGEPDMNKFFKLLLDNLPAEKTQKIINSWKAEISVWDEVYQNGKLDYAKSPITLSIPKNDLSWILDKFFNIDKSQ